jgi:hypothetical protein
MWEHLRTTGRHGVASASAVVTHLVRGVLA